MSQSLSPSPFSGGKKTRRHRKSHKGGKQHKKSQSGGKTKKNRSRRHR